MPLWIYLAIAALTVAFLFLMPQPKFENARASGFDDLRVPQAKEGMPISLGLGTFMQRGPNCIWYGDFEARPIKKKVKTGIFSSKRVIVGYEYFVGMDMVLCLGPNVRIKSIKWDKEVLWEGDVSVSGTAIVINKPDLFGGKEKGGGFVGTLRFYAGNWNETPNAYLESVIDSPLGVPAYNGQCRLVFEKVNIGESAQLRPLSIELERLTNDVGLADPALGADMNPAELMYQVMTLEWGGMGIAATDIDIPALIEAGATLADENNGQTLLISSVTQGKNVAEEVLRQVDGVLYQDPDTGKIVLDLIRDDYDEFDLPVLDESNIIQVRDFSATVWDTTINQLRVSYNDREKGYETGMVMAKDMANINAQGRLKSSTANYPGIYNATLANEVCHRELAQLSVPLMKVTLELNRMPVDLRPGQPFIWSWPEYQIEQVVMRVQKFNLGELLNGKLVLEAIQDNFAISSTVISSPPGTGWTPIPKLPAAEAIDRLVQEGHYFFFQAAGEAAALGPNQTGILVAAKAPTGGNQAEVNVSTNGGTTYDVAEEGLVFTAVGELETALTATTGLPSGIISSMTVSGFDIEEVPSYSSAERTAGAGMFIIGREYFVYESRTDNMDGTITLSNVWRGLLDSVPIAHDIGDPVYMIDGDNFIDDIYPGDEVLRVKLLTSTINETLSLADAPFDSITLRNRVYRPAAPGNIKFNGGTAFEGPVSTAGAVTVSWANRSRLDASLRTLGSTNNSFEPGQRTVVRYKVNAGAWAQVIAEPGLQSVTFDPGSAPGDMVTFEVFSTRDGLDSYNKWTFLGEDGGVAASAGGGASEDSGGTPPDDEQDEYAGLTDLTIVFPFGENIGTYPIDVPITFQMEIPDDFVGSNADVRTNPTGGTVTFTIRKNGSSIGSMTITTGGVVAFSTSGGVVSLVSGDTLTVDPPSPENAALKGVTVSIAATKVMS